MRLRRSDPSRPGWGRRRAGRGFVYLDPTGRRLPPDDAQRCRDLAIPPAWESVWICPWPTGHLQAVGLDAAGRRQYLYHPQWRTQRDRDKHRRVVSFAAALAGARAIVAEDLARRGLPRERGLAVAFRMLDLGHPRVGGEQYAAENGSVGLATLRVGHVQVGRGRVRLRFPGKSGVEQDLVLADAALVPAVRALVRGRPEDAELLGWRRPTGEWADITSSEINDYVREVTGCEATAKDFRTWHATVQAALHLASVDEAPTTRTARARLVRAACAQVAERLGNTAAVSRRSYVDHRLIDAFEAGTALDLPHHTDEWARVLAMEGQLIDLLGP